MNIPQSTYSRSFDAAFPGQLGDTGPHRIEGRINNEGANVAAGILVRDSGAGTFDLIDGATEKLAGAVLNTFARNPGDQAVQLAGSEAIMDGGNANILVAGAVWLTCETAMATTDTVYVRHTANGAGKTVLGAVRNDTDGGNARQVYGARVVRTADAAGVAQLYVDVAVDRAHV